MPRSDAVTLRTPDDSSNPRPWQIRDCSMPTEEQIVSTSNNFGLTLFKEIAGSVPDSNVVISPLSVSMALGMTLNGAAGTTLDDMRYTLGLSGYSTDAMNQRYRDLIDLLTSLDPEVQFQIANSVWCRDGIPFKEPFLLACDTYFDAQATNLDFGRADASEIINGWVAERTHDKITQIVDDVIDPLTMIILLNAIYFQGTWTHGFDPEKTSDRGFRLPDGTRRVCRMMCQPDSCDYYTYLSTSRFDALDMAYGDSLFSMTVFLPKNQNTIASVIEDFSESNWDVWMDGFRPWRGYLFLPRFEVEYGLEMEDVLTSLGMGIIFDPLRADFTRMCTYFSDFYIKRVRHKTYMRVDEYGTVAAAVTEVEGGPTGIPPQFWVTKPFLFVIRENHANTILFIGQITDPGYFTD